MIFQGLFLQGKNQERAGSSSASPQRTPWCSAGGVSGGMPRRVQSEQRSCAEQQRAGGESLGSSQAAGIQPFSRRGEVKSQHQGMSQHTSAVCPRDQSPPCSHTAEGTVRRRLSVSGCSGRISFHLSLKRKAIAIARAGVQSALFSFLLNEQ